MGDRYRGSPSATRTLSLSKALGDAVRRGHLVVSPVTRVDVPARDDSVERVAWTLEEARAFLSVAADDRPHGVWRLLLATGLRRGELLGLTWDDISEGSATDPAPGTRRVRRGARLRPRDDEDPSDETGEVRRRDGCRLGELEGRAGT